MSSKTKTKKKKIPRFRSEQEERVFWESADSTEYIDWSEAKRLRFPDLKPSLKTISLRLPEMMLVELKALANRQDVPYQSLLKIYLAERIAAELEASPSRRPATKPRPRKAAKRRA